MYVIEEGWGYCSSRNFFCQVQYSWDSGTSLWAMRPWTACLFLFSLKHILPNYKLPPKMVIKEQIKRISERLPFHGSPYAYSRCSLVLMMCSCLRFFLFLFFYTAKEFGRYYVGDPWALAKYEARDMPFSSEHWFGVFFCLMVCGHCFQYYTPVLYALSFSWAAQLVHQLSRHAWHGIFWTKFDSLPYERVWTCFRFGRRITLFFAHLTVCFGPALRPVLPIPAPLHT